MGATYFTVFATLIWISLFISIVVLFRRFGLLYRYFSINILFLIIFTCLFRVFVPIEFSPFTKVIRSDIYMIHVYKIMLYPLLSFRIWRFSVVLTVGKALLIISLTGSFIVLYKKIKENIFLYRVLKTVIPTNDKRIMEMVKYISENIGIKKDIKIVVNKGVTSPAIIGRLDPIIILPDISFSDNELKGILVHELMHYKYNHILIKLLADMVEIVFWWDPLIRRFGCEVDNILELHADSRLSRMLDSREQQEYLVAIIKVIDNMKDRALPDAAMGLVNKDESVLEQRFMLLLSKAYNKRNTRNNILITTAFLILFVVSYMFVVQPYSEPTYSEYHDNAPTITPGSYIVMGKDTYTIYNAEGKIIAEYEYPVSERFNILEIRNTEVDNNEKS